MASRIKRVKVKDIFAFFILLFMIIPSIIYKIYLKIKNKHIYLICEDAMEARDNGYHLFKFIRENYPNDLVYYAICKESKDYKKVEKLGNVINFYSLKHWLYYLTADVNISTHKNGNPNQAIFYLLQVYGILKNKRVFLQHGITMNKVDYVNFKNSKFRLFICGAKKEFDFVKDEFGYPIDNVKLLGFSRFDNLYNNQIDKKKIVIMPTWRSYITNNNFDECEYFKRYNGLLNNSNLIKYIEKEDINIYFYLHRKMKKYENKFTTTSKNIIIVKDNEFDIQALLKNSSLLITDYSSVSMDFAYMNKPVIYYQFDREEFASKHLKPGYFSYLKDGFGKVIKSEDDLVNKIIAYSKMDYKLEVFYQKRIDNFFELRDDQNSSRIYEAIKEL